MESRDQKRISDISVIQIALEQFFQKKGVYPLQLTDLSPTYISEIPTDLTNDYKKQYFPITKTPITPSGTSGSDYCISYQLWTRFERSNQYIDSKKGFDSTSLPSGLYECGTVGNHNNAKINAASKIPDNTLVYDVMP